MSEEENKVTDKEEREVVLKDVVYPYENEPYEAESSYKEPSYSETMEKAKSVDIAKNTYVYTNAEDSLNENMSTAWTFLCVGVVGIIFTVLNLTGVLHIMQGGLQKGLTLLIFIAFMVYGIWVIRSKKDMIAKVEKEKSDRKKYTEWMKEKFTDEVLSNLGTMEASAEELELLQINYMSDELVKHFPEINPNFADRLAEDFFGVNSIFNSIFIPLANLFNIFNVGFLVPFSSLLISAWLIPVLSDNCF